MNDIKKYQKDMETYLLEYENWSDSDLLQGEFISHNNEKLGKIPSFSLPAVKTCENCTECQKFCYIIAEHEYRPNLLKRYCKNYIIINRKLQYLEAAVSYESIMNRFFRWFVSGDIPSAEFFGLMVKIARKNKSTKYLCYTKKYDIVNNYISNGGKIPKNLVIIFSVSCRLKNPYNLPLSLVYKTRTPKVDKNNIVCSGKCSECAAQGVGCWNLKEGQRVWFEAHGKGKNAATDQDVKN